MHSGLGLSKLKAFLVVLAFAAFLFNLPGAATVDLTQMNCVIVLGSQSNPMSFSQCIANTMPLAFIGIALSFALVGISYVIGDVIRLDGFTGWYKNELWETIKTIAIVLSIFSIIMLLGVIATNLAGNPQGPSCSFTVTSAQSALESSLSGLYQSVFCGYIYPELNLTTSAYSNMILFADGFELLKDMTFTTSLSLGVNGILIIPETGTTLGIQETSGGTFNIFQSSVLATIGLLTYSLISQLINLVLVPMAALFATLYTEFPFIVEVGLAVFIPLGIILRALPFLRPIGATLIALGIGVAIVYPAILLLFNLPLSNYLSATLGLPLTTQTGIQGTYTPVCNTQNGQTQGCNIGGFQNLLDTVMGFTSTVLTRLESFSIGLITPLSSLYPSFNFAMQTELNSIIQFLLNIFDIIMFVVITSDIARLMGGSITFGIGQLKLV
jgi:hypothetical protein